MFKALRDNVWRVIVAVHELIGHGCGRLLKEVAKDKFNFDPQSPPQNPVTHEPVDSWYREGQNPKSVFGKLHAGLNECLAESIGLLFVADPMVMSLLAHDKNPEECRSTHFVSLPTL